MYGDLRKSGEMRATLFKQAAPIITGVGPDGLLVTLDTYPVDVYGDGSISAKTSDYAAKQYGYAVRAEIRLHYRSPGKPSDGAFVRSTMSSIDGTWEFTNLNIDLRFDVVARLDGARDVIISDVSPRQ